MPKRQRIEAASDQAPSPQEHEDSQTATVDDGGADSDSSSSTRASASSRAGSTERKEGDDDTRGQDAMRRMMMLVQHVLVDPASAAQNAALWEELMQREKEAQDAITPYASIRGAVKLGGEVFARAAMRRWNELHPETFHKTLLRLARVTADSYLGQVLCKCVPTTLTVAMSGAQRWKDSFSGAGACVARAVALRVVLPEDMEEVAFGAEFEGRAWPDSDDDSEDALDAPLDKLLEAATKAGLDEKCVQWLRDMHEDPSEEADPMPKGLESVLWSLLLENKRWLCAIAKVFAKGGAPLSWIHQVTSRTRASKIVTQERMPVLADIEEQYSPELVMEDKKSSDVETEWL